MQAFTYHFYYNGENYQKMIFAETKAEADKSWAQWLDRNPRAIAIKKQPVVELQGDMAQQFNESQDIREEEEDFFEGY